MFAATALTTAAAQADPLNVTVVNGVSGKPLSGQSVTAYERLADGSRKWAGKRTTDASGRATWDLKGLDTGRQYQLRAKPYHGDVWSIVLTRSGNHQFKVGRVQARLINGVDGKSLANTTSPCIGPGRVESGNGSCRPGPIPTASCGSIRLD